MRTSGPNEFNFSRGLETFVCIALLNIWGHQDQMSSTTAELLRSLHVSIALLNLWGHRDQMRSTTLERLRSFLLLIAKYMRTSGPNEFNYCRGFEIFVSIALLNIWGHQDQMSWTTALEICVLFALLNTWGHQDQMSSTTAERFWSFFMALLNIWGHQDQIVGVALWRIASARDCSLDVM
jgi:hypothetical protein